MRAATAFIILVCSLLLSESNVASDVRPQFGIYRSTDNGHSWTRVARGVPFTKRINALLVADGVSYAGTDGGILISGDDGQSWSLQPLTASFRVQCLYAARERVFAGTTTGVLVSEDRGRTWRKLDRGLTDNNVRSIGGSGIMVRAGTDSAGVFVLTAREQWAEFGTGLPSQGQVFDLAFTNDYFFAALYNKGLYRRAKNRNQWERVGSVVPLEIVTQGKAVIAGHNPGGIYQSPDEGQTWKAASGLTGRAPIWVLGHATSGLLAGTTPGVLLRSDDSGASWKASASGIPDDASVVAIASGPRHTLVGVVF